MGTTERHDNPDGACAPVDILGAPTVASHAMRSTEPAQPHPAFLTDGGPTLQLESAGQIMTRRWAAVKMIGSIGAVVIAAECITAGLAANAASQVDSTSISTSTALDPQAIFAIAFAAFVEVALFAITSFCFLFCNFHFAYFLVVGFVGFSAIGTGAYGLAVMAISMSNSVCGDAGSCNEALKKGLAAACLRVLLTAPFCLTLTSWYFSRPEEKSRETERSYGDSYSDRMTDLIGNPCTYRGRTVDRPFGGVAQLPLTASIWDTCTRRRSCVLGRRRRHPRVLCRTAEPMQSGLQQTEDKRVLQITLLRCLGQLNVLDVLVHEAHLPTLNLANKQYRAGFPQFCPVAVFLPCHRPPSTTMSPDGNAPRQHRDASPYKLRRVSVVDAVPRRQADLEVAPGNRRESVHGHEAELFDHDSSSFGDCDLGSVESHDTIHAQETTAGPGDPVAGRRSFLPGSGQIHQSESLTRDANGSVPPTATAALLGILAVWMMDSPRTKHY